MFSFLQHATQRLNVNIYYVTEDYVSLGPLQGDIIRGVTVKVDDHFGPAEIEFVYCGTYGYLPKQDIKNPDKVRGS